MERGGAVRVVGQLGQLGTGQRGEQLPMVGQQAPQPGDASPDDHEVIEQLVAPVVAQRLCVEQVDLVLDRVNGGEVARDGGAEQ